MGISVVVERYGSGVRDHDRNIQIEFRLIEPFLEESTALREILFLPTFSSDCSLFPIFDEFVAKSNQIFRRF